MANSQPMVLYKTIENSVKLSARFKLVACNTVTGRGGINHLNTGGL